MDLELSPICRWCGLGPLKPAFSFEPPGGVEGLGRGPFRLTVCEECGSWQLNPHPSLEECRRFFSSPDRWLAGSDPEGGSVDPLARAESRVDEYRLYAATMKALMPESGAILDVGAGTGLMLSLLDVPHRRLAVEPNQLAAEKARLRGLEVTTQWAEDIQPRFGSLAALIMNQSLDHLTRPDLFLGRALHWLAPGGLALLSGLTNPNSLCARLYGPSHRLFHPFHQVYPPPSAVSRLLDPWGLELTAVWRPYLSTPHGSVGKFLTASAAMTLKLLRLGSGGPSPAFPGNSVTYLLRRKIVQRPLIVTEPSADSIKVAC